ncbi:hypothetical protein PR048_010290 [Dryococelus australis]|uniref:Uncharacterized protein n=1 Tax=Dryococelus australis TaxID=614101 RepID=A0ABQ9I354_9NEOP|nr:hypothetical protein PR048_010290 [Dryococelus australis]
MESNGALVKRDAIPSKGCEEVPSVKAAINDCLEGVVLAASSCNFHSFMWGQVKALEVMEEHCRSLYRVSKEGCELGSPNVESKCENPVCPHLPTGSRLNSESLGFLNQTLNSEMEENSYDSKLSYFDFVPNDDNEIDLNNFHLEGAPKENLLAALREFSDIFLRKDQKLAFTDRISHIIDAGDAKPLCKTVQSTTKPKGNSKRANSNYVRCGSHRYPHAALGQH